MPLFSAPSPLLISTPSSPAAAASHHHHHHHPHHHPHHRPINQFRSPAATNSYFSNTPAHSNPYPSTSSLATHAAAGSGGPGASSSGKRSRDDDDDGDDDAQMSAVRDGSVTPPQARSSPSAQHRNANAPSRSQRPMVHKKIRSFAQQGQGGNGAGSDADAAAAASIDLGKMLASLDRPELLSLVMRLLTSSTDPTLPAQVQALLPAPSLESINTTLNALEAAIQQAMPIAGARAEYVWGRVRGPLNEFAMTAVGFAETLLQRRNGGVSSSSSSSAFGSAATTELDPDGHVHPTTAFAFLLDLTARVLRIERALPPPPKSIFFATPSASSSASTSAAGGVSGSGANGVHKGSSQQTSAFLVFKDVMRQKASSSSSSSSSVTSPGGPVSVFGSFGQSPAAPSSAFSTLTNGGGSPADALVTILVPTLLSQWDTLLRRLSSAVNGQGRMFGQEVVLGWYRALNALGSEGAPRANGNGNGNGSKVTPAFSAFGGSSASFQPRPSFGFSYGAPAASSSFGFGAAAPTSSSTSSFGFGSMTMPSSASQQSASQQQQQQESVRAEEEALRGAMDWVRDVFEREIGWLVGLDKMRAAAAASGGTV